MSRFRWYRLEGQDISWEHLGQEMNTEDFRPESTRGFRLSRVGEQGIEGKYIEKRVIVRQTEDPFGDTKSFEQETYDIVTFKLLPSEGVLRLENPPRRFTQLFTKLGLLSGFSIAVVPLVVDVRKWLQTIELNCGPLEVTKVLIANFPVSGDAQATISLRRPGDIRDLIHDTLLLRNQKWTGLTYAIGGCGVTLGSNGTADTEAPLEHFRVVEEALLGCS